MEQAQEARRQQGAERKREEVIFFFFWVLGGFGCLFVWLFFGGVLSVARGNASGFWSLTVLPGGQGFLGRLGAPEDLFEFRVRGCSQGFLRGSFGRA